MTIYLSDTGVFFGETVSKFSEDFWRHEYCGVVFVAKFKVNFNGNTIDFKQTDSKYIKNPQNLGLNAFLHIFHGTVNSNGTVINGYWMNEETANNYFDYRKY